MSISWKEECAKIKEWGESKWGWRFKFLEHDGDMGLAPSFTLSVWPLAPVTISLQIYAHISVEELSKDFEHLVDVSLRNTWISIQNGAPKDGQRVIFYTTNSYESQNDDHIFMGCYRFFDDDHRFFGDHGCGITDVTHWMELPNPPE